MTGQPPVLATSSVLALQTGIRDYLTAGAIPGVGRWYRDYPTRMTGAAFAVGTVGPWGAIGWPHAATVSERRLSLPAGAGLKEITYRIGLVLGFQWRVPPDLADGDEDAWVDPFDTLLDAVCNRLRADQTLGGCCLMAGEDTGAGAGAQLSISRGMPQLDKGVLHLWTGVEFDALVVIRA